MNSAQLGYQPGLGNRPSTTVGQRHCRQGRDGRTRTCGLVFPKHMGWPLPYIPICSPCSPFQTVSSPYGSRTRLPGLKGRCPVPIDERAVRGAYLSRMRAIAGAHSSRSGSGGARILVRGFSGRRYAISATDPTKKARCLVTPGFGFPQGIGGRVSQAQWIQAEHIGRLLAGNPPRIASFV